MKHAVSLSGGRTSTGVLPDAVIKEHGSENVDLIFCDTGAEHPDTYRFIRDVEIELGKKITCLKLILPKEKGVGCRYEVCGTDEIKNDYKAWKQLTSKYGNPFIPGGKTCTDQMKSAIFKKYCSDKYGKDGFYTWVGYRFEEGNRIWGKDASRVLGNLGMTNTEKTNFFLNVKRKGIESVLYDHFPAMFECESDTKEKNYIRKSYETITKRNFRFLCELSDYKKEDVIQWWSDKNHDLKIGEHEMNCVFCPEKPVAVVMLAAKDNPKMAKEFLDVVESEDVADRKNGTDKLVMYRGKISFRWIYEKSKELDRNEIAKMSKLGMDMIKVNSCQKGECSPFGDIHEEQMEMF